MSIIKHQNNFGTNLTSNQIAGVTTTPLNSIPTVAAPFYLALDATNVNGKYEVIYVTSKTATDVLHAATSYAHTTAEEVRMVVPAAELDNLVATPGTDNVIPINLAEGQMINGQIVPSVASNNLTVALKTKAGTDPSATDPVYVMIGGTLRTITSAKSITATAAGGGWFNSNGAELAAKEIDYFVYLGYNATDGVVLGVARIPYANIYSDFVHTPLTNEKFGYISTETNAVASDAYVNIGRFAATLAATTNYWSVPTFTASNLIQRPIYETRWLNWVPTQTSGTGTPTTKSANTCSYKLRMNECFINVDVVSTNVGTASSTWICTLPMSTTWPSLGHIVGRECGVSGKMITGQIPASPGTQVQMLDYNNATLWVNSYQPVVTGSYKI